ncbi:hypothetical protein BV898_19018, partial [Hypsibius exemplaris]
SFMHLGAGLSVGLSGLGAGFAVGIVGDCGVRGSAQQPRLFVCMILILIFAEVLGLYGMIVGLILATKTGGLQSSLHIAIAHRCLTAAAPFHKLLTAVLYRLLTAAHRAPPLHLQTLSPLLNRLLYRCYRCSPLLTAAHNPLLTAVPRAHSLAAHHS